MLAQKRTTCFVLGLAFVARSCQSISPPPVATASPTGSIQVALTVGAPAIDPFVASFLAANNSTFDLQEPPADVAITAVRAIEIVASRSRGGRRRVRRPAREPRCHRAAESVACRSRWTGTRSAGRVAAVAVAKPCGRIVRASSELVLRVRVRRGDGRIDDHGRRIGASAVGSTSERSPVPPFR